MNNLKASLAPAEIYRTHTIEWICQFDPALFVTFVFNAQLCPDEARRKLEAFHMRVDRKLVGRAMLRKPEQRSTYIATIEKPETNLHIHALFKLTPRQSVAFALVAPSVWNELAPAGNIDVQRVTNAAGVGAYVTKALRPETSERLLLPVNLGQRAT